MIGSCRRSTEAEITKLVRLVRRQWAGFLALFLVLAGGGAYAAFDPVGRDGDIDACFERKSGDLDIRRGKRCGKRERPIAWSQTGPPGKAGPRGAPGPAGPAGRSALSPLRSGETINGVVGVEQAAAAGEQIRVLETLPIAAPQPLTNDMVVVDGPYEGSAVCRGSFASPTAPPGRVCIYEVQAAIGENTEDEEGIAAAFNDGAVPSGFGLRIYATATGDVKFFASWAYTAP